MALTKVLITVKTYPAISSKYDELVCTAGFREDGTGLGFTQLSLQSMFDLSRKLFFLCGGFSLFDVQNKFFRV